MSSAPDFEAPHVTEEEDEEAENVVEEDEDEAEENEETLPLKTGRTDKEETVEEEEAYADEVGKDEEEEEAEASQSRTMPCTAIMSFNESPTLLHNISEISTLGTLRIESSRADQPSSVAREALLTGNPDNNYSTKGERFATRKSAFV
jgi:hypothetical protein